MNEASQRMVGLLKQRHPSAIAYVRRLAHRHYHGDQIATRALQNIAAAAEDQGMSFAGAAAGPVAFLTNLVKNVGHLGGRVVGTAGRVVQGAGSVVAKVATAAAKPFAYVETKLGGKKPIRLLPPHTHVP
jgi:hypothetical protein